MGYRIIFSAAAGGIALLLTLFFSKKDPEMKPLRWWAGATLLLGTGASDFFVMYFYREIPIAAVVVFTVFLAVCVITDSLIYKVYTVVNLANVLCMAVFYFLYGGREPMLFVMAAVFLAMGFAGAFGRGDGYVMAASILFIGIAGKSYLTSVLVYVLSACVLFLLYSGIAFLAGQRKTRQKIRLRSFLKQKRPFIPSAAVGLLISLFAFHQ